jgi:cytochrome oxidase Cu insertion factor (SCO1/SenC/PrrC family)
LDPEHDPPAVMRDLARRFDADSRAWIFASGSIADVHRVMNAFGVVAQMGPHGYAETHSTFVYLVDARGRVRERLLASTVLASDIVERER